MDCLHDKSKTFAFFALCNMRLWAEKRRRQEGSWNCFHVTLWRPQPFPQIDSEFDTVNRKVDQRHLGDRSFLELFLRYTLKTAALCTARAWARLIDSESDTSSTAKGEQRHLGDRKVPGTVSKLPSQDCSPLHSDSSGTVDRFWIWCLVNLKRWTASSFL